jgi:aminopeptidase N
MQAVNGAYREKLIERFSAIDTYSIHVSGSSKEGIEERMLKNVLLDLIAAEDGEPSHNLIVSHYRSAINITDKVAALTALNRSSAPERRELLEAAYLQWHGHLSGYSNYLRIVSSGTCRDVFEMIEAERNRPTFDITQPTWCRALFLPMATNNKMVWSNRGIRWVTDTVIELSPINTTTASRLLNTFQQVRKLKPDLREKVLKGLEEIVRRVTGKANPTIHGQAGAYLGRD